MPVLSPILLSSLLLSYAHYLLPSFYYRNSLAQVTENQMRICLTFPVSVAGPSSQVRPHSMFETLPLFLVIILIAEMFAPSVYPFQFFSLPGDCAVLLAAIPFPAKLSL